jgi:hypothetical protein
MRVRPAVSPSGKENVMGFVPHIVKVLLKKIPLSMSLQQKESRPMGDVAILKKGIKGTIIVPMMGITPIPTR